LLRKRSAFERDLKSVEVNLVSGFNRLVLPALRKVLDSGGILDDVDDLYEAVVVALT
jgi:hypothetical protein